MGIKTGKKLIQEFSFPNRSYIVDFFLQENLLLECSFTQSSQYDGLFRQKAIQLEAKSAFIKRFYPYPMCVLFESTHSIGEKLFTTLTSLMPSIDYFFTSRFELLEILPLIQKLKQNILQDLYVKVTKNTIYRFQVILIFQKFIEVCPMHLTFTK